MADRSLRSTTASLLALVGAGIASFLVGREPIIGSVAVVAAVGAVVLLAQPLLGIEALALTLIVGQLVRVSAFGVEGALLPSDVVVGGLVTAWILRGLLQRRLEFVRSPLSWPFATMIVVLVATFIVGALQLPFLTSRQELSSALYAVRWLEFPLLFFLVADFVRNERQGRRVVRALLTAAVALAMLGFIQLRLFPDFRFMVPQGWDPHLGRLLSTWFDPNFLAGFFSVIFCLLGGIAALTKDSRQRLVAVTFAGLLFAAIVLTLSRSGYAAFLSGVALLTLLRSRRLFLLLLMVGVLVVFAVPRVHERVVGAFNVDATAKLRVVSWRNALSVVRDYPLTGIGYNTYRYVQVDYGFVKDAAEHSAGGSDSSLLTILVTTGPVGLAAYGWILWSMWSIAWSAYRRGATPYVRGLGLGAGGAVVSVTAHSFFINSLLFPHMMLTLALIWGALVGMRNSERAGGP